MNDSTLPPALQQMLKEALLAEGKRPQVRNMDLQKDRVSEKEYVKVKYDIVFF